MVTGSVLIIGVTGCSGWLVVVLVTGVVVTDALEIVAGVGSVEAGAASAGAGVTAATAAFPSSVKRTILGVAVGDSPLAGAVGW
jgi:hypothetical protein